MKTRMKTDNIENIYYPYLYILLLIYKLKYV